MEFKQLSIFDFLTEMDNQRENLNTNKAGCYIFARIKNAVPYFLQYCDNDMRCGLCRIDKEYLEMRDSLILEGYSFFDATHKAKEMMQSQYEEQIA